MLAAVLLLVGGLSFAQAQSERDLKVDLIAKKVVKDDQGKETLVPGDQAKSGDILEYTATYSNKTGKGFRDVAANLPIPAGTEFIPGSSKPEGALGTTDGRTFQPLPLKRKVKSGSETREEDVPPALYRSLRWKLGGLASDESKSVSARVRVNALVVLPTK
jgi:uncharacterized repeat protein (TIGR01451 family)